METFDWVVCHLADMPQETRGVKFKTGDLGRLHSSYEIRADGTLWVWFDEHRWLPISSCDETVFFFGKDNNGVTRGFTVQFWEGKLEHFKEVKYNK